ncbi:MAG TPA: S24 family peptidase [Nevskia sp.]|nr:S24 family peptidase [Nevskia sp.]
MALKDRIKELRGKRSQQLMASIAGISQPMWSKLERGETEDTALLPKIADAHGVSLEWLAYGKGAMGEVVESPIRVFHPDDPPAEDEVRIPESRVKFSGGHGHEPVYETVEDVEPATYRLSWFQKERINPNKTKRFRVIGSSMEPLLWPGDSVLVNLEETNVRSGQIYVFRHGNELKVKTLTRKSDGALVLGSINKANYPDDVVPASEVDEAITIIGRVRDKSGRGGLAGWSNGEAVPARTEPTEDDKAWLIRELLERVKKRFPTFSEARQVAVVVKVYEWCLRHPSVSPAEAMELAGGLTE